MSQGQESFAPKSPVVLGNDPAEDIDRTRNVLNDMLHFLTSAQRIVDRGRATYFDPADDTQQLAMSAIIINLATAAGRLPNWIKELNNEVPWGDLKATRNYLAHDYAGSSQPILWETAVRDFPVLAGQVRKLYDAVQPAEQRPHPEINPGMERG